MANSDKPIVRCNQYVTGQRDQDGTYDMYEADTHDCSHIFYPPKAKTFDEFINRLKKRKSNGLN